MSEFQGVIVVNISDSQNNEDNIERSSLGTNNRNNYTSSVVPITGMDIENRMDTIQNSSSIETDIWNNCISSEFPIMRMDIEDGIATCQIGRPHLGFTMMAMINDEEDDEDIILDGKAKIYDPSGQLCAKFYYEKGEATGECKLYYESGKLYFNGYLDI